MREPTSEVASRVGAGSALSPAGRLAGAGIAEEGEPPSTLRPNKSVNLAIPTPPTTHSINAVWKV